MKIYLVFHVFLLEQAAETPLEGQIIPPLPPIEVKGEEEYEVDETLNSQVYQKCLEYLVN